MTYRSLIMGMATFVVSSFSAQASSTIEVLRIYEGGIVASVGNWAWSRWTGT